MAEDFDFDTIVPRESCSVPEQRNAVMKIALESFYFGILFPIDGHRERKEQV